MRNTRHVVIEDTTLDVNDCVINTDQRLWIADQMYFLFKNIYDYPETKNIAYSAGTPHAVTITLAATALNSVEYTLHITQTDPYTGAKYAKTYSYTTTATGTPTATIIMAALATAADADANWTAAATTDHILVTAGTAAGGFLDVWITSNSASGATATVAQTTPYVTPKGTIAELTSYGLTTTAGHTYNHVIIAGFENNASSMTEVTTKEIIHFWFYKDGGGIDTLYNELVNLLQGDSTYQTLIRGWRKIPQ